MEAPTTAPSVLSKFAAGEASRASPSPCVIVAATANKPRTKSHTFAKRIFPPPGIRALLPEHYGPEAQRLEGVASSLPGSVRGPAEPAFAEALPQHPEQEEG